MSWFLDDTDCCSSEGWGFLEDPVCLQCPAEIMSPCHLLKPGSETYLYCGDKSGEDGGGRPGAELVLNPPSGLFHFVCLGLTSWSFSRSLQGTSIFGQKADFSIVGMGGL